MAAGAEVVVRRTLDLTRAPREQWNDEMFELVAKMVLRRASSLGEQVYCLAVADSLGLNPLIDEIYFLPVKSTDGSGASLKPYIGRNGLVKKATERGYYFETDTVREHDRFRMTRQRDGSRTVTHSYGHEKDRGEIVGAYAFLHRRGGGELPAFFYAPLDEYLPTFDAEWKMDKSPWGNQRSAMIQKCFDADTEVLTDRGFEPFAAAQGRVLQVTGRGLAPTDARPFWQPYDGPMVTHESREVDFAVTLNHDMVLTDGRMEAREVFDRARSRITDGLAIPRVVTAWAQDDPWISDESLRLAGYFMADGHSDSKSTIVFNLARERKLGALRSLGFPLVERPGRRAGAPGNLTATLDATWLRCPAECLPSFMLEGKRIDVAAVLRLSPRQARVFVDAWREFDGDAKNRLYCTDPARLGAFEAIAVHAGYSVSPRRSRLNLDLSERPNYHITLSNRAASNLRRWGARNERPGLRMRPADGRGVWCVTVPSGTIVVRRHGFSMLCGNCSMIGAGRERLDLGGVLIDGELPIFEQMQAAGPGATPAPESMGEFDFNELPADRETTERLRVAAEAAGWPIAKCEMVMRGMSEDALRALADQLEAEAEQIRGVSPATEGVTGTRGPVAEDRASEGADGSERLTDVPEPVRATDHAGGEVQRLASEMAASSEPVIADAVVVPDAEHVAALRKRVESLEERLNDPFEDLGEDAARDLAEELERVRGELAAAEDPGQGRLI